MGVESRPTRSSQADRRIRWCIQLTVTAPWPDQRRAHDSSGICVEVDLQLRLEHTDALPNDVRPDRHSRATIGRPITAIRLADTDSNPLATADPAWTPLATTPADASCPGAHSVISGAAATVRTARYGNHLDIAVTSPTLPGVTATVHNFGGRQPASARRHR
jgi:hypothetical protein